jgi:hypothetical protein
MGYCKNENT